MNGNNLTPGRRTKPKRRRDARRTSRFSPRCFQRRNRRRGLTAIEYCFMLSLIFVFIVLAVQHVGSSLKDSFKHSDSKMQDIGL